MVLQVAQHRERLDPLEAKSLDNLSLRDLMNPENPVMYCVPRGIDIERIVSFAEGLKGEEREGLPIILDVAGGLGALGFLLAQTNRAKVITSDLQIPPEDSSYDHPNLMHVRCDGHAVDKVFSVLSPDLVLNSMMPKKFNFTPAMRRIGARGIAYICSTTGETGIGGGRAYCNMNNDRDLKVEDALSYHPGDQYREFVQWKMVERGEAEGFYRHGAMYHILNPTGRIRLQVSRELQDRDITRIYDRISESALHSSPTYSWEREIPYADSFSELRHPSYEVEQTSVESVRP